jgi:cell division protein FtsQ
LQSVTHQTSPKFHGWHDEARYVRASRDSLHQHARKMLRHVPERPTLGWFEANADALSSLAFMVTLALYLITAAYSVHISGRWEEVRGFGLKTANELAAAGGLGIAKVTIEGRNHVTEEQVSQALGVSKGVSIFAFDTAAARDRLLQNGWIREARVMRLLPSTLVVELEERSPFAIWREGGESVVIDAQGKVLAEVKPASFPTVPTVSGPGAASPAKEIVEMIRTFPELAGHVRDMERIAGRRWDLVLDTGLRAKLPAGHLKAALAELNGIVARNPAALYELSEIDFRLGSQFTLRLKDSSEDGRKKFMSWFAKKPKEGAL